MHSSEVTEKELEFLRTLRLYGITDADHERMQRPDSIDMRYVVAAILRTRPLFSARVGGILKMNEYLSEPSGADVLPDLRYLQIHTKQNLIDSVRNFGDGSAKEVARVLESLNLRLRHDDEPMHERVNATYQSSLREVPVQVLLLSGVIDVDQMLGLWHLGIRYMENFCATTRTRLTVSTHGRKLFYEEELDKLTAALWEYGISLTQ